MAFFGKPPRVASLCAVFWRGCVLIPLLLFLCGCGIAAILVQFYMYFWQTTMGILGIALWASFVIGIVAAACWVETKVKRDGVLPKAFRDSVPFHGAKAIKQRLCPLIEIGE
jgi:hypothetical protein